MISNFYSIRLCLSFCIYLNCVSTLVGSGLTHLGQAEEEVSKTDGINTDIGPVVPSVIDTLKVSKKTDKVIEIPFDKPAAGQSPKEFKDKPRPPSKEGISHLVLEGGGAIDLKSTAVPIDSQLDIETVDESTTHSKGSKPRKGVQHPGSSVVPRKGVSIGSVNLNESSIGITSDPTKESIHTSSVNQIVLKTTDISMPKIETDQQQHSEHQIQKLTHPKKPVVVTDLEDVDDFEKYPIIQTSTTGEDYIIIGIAIVLGIWCSIFGALIFYRRAGEYWDRRHYRRMDFLVEGMYND